MVVRVEVKGIELVALVPCAWRWYSPVEKAWVMREMAQVVGVRVLGAWQAWETPTDIKSLSGSLRKANRQEVSRWNALPLEVVR